MLVSNALIIVVPALVTLLVKTAIQIIICLIILAEHVLKDVLAVKMKLIAWHARTAMLFLEINVLNVSMAVFFVMISVQKFALNVLLVFSYKMENANTVCLTALIVKAFKIVLSAN